jgi:hypothetical protein
MNIRILTCGVIGGLLATYFLSFPLYLTLPGRYIPDWPGFASPWLGALGYLLTAVAAVSTGYAAARWDWQTTRRGRADTGALAGMIAGLVAYALIGAAAAAVASQEAVWRHGPHAAGDERAFIAIVVDCVIKSAWLPFLTFWGMFAGGTVLGCLGGWVADMDPAASHWGATPPRRATASVFDSSVALMLMGVLILLTVLGAITTLEANCAKSIAEYGLQPALPTAGVIGCPLVMTLVMTIVATAFCGQWCASRWNHPLLGMKRTARLAGIMMVALPVFTILLVAKMRPDMFEQWYFLAGQAAWFGVVMFWLVCIVLRPGPAPGLPPPTSPSFRDRLVLNAGFIGATYPALVLATGVTQAIALALGIVPNLATLQARKPVAPTAVQMVGTAAGSSEPLAYGAVAGLADGKVEAPSPPAPAPSAHALMQDIFAIHLWGACTMVAIWFIATVIHSFIVQALPAVWQARVAAAARQTAPPQTATPT